MAILWIDVEDNAGNRYGDGPIITATGWRVTPRVDEAGEFSFTMPAGDPRAALLANKRVAHAWTMDNGEEAEVGLGIIDMIRRIVVPGRPEMVAVSGRDVLGELAWRQVGDLTVKELAWTFLTPDPVTAEARGAVRWLRTQGGDHEDRDLEDCYDGEIGPESDSIYLFNGAYPDMAFLYVGHDARFNRIHIYLGDRVNDLPATLEGQYWNGTAWAGLSIADGTSVGGCTLAQSGVVSWTRPMDWVRNTPTAQSGHWFWMRFTVGEGETTQDDPRTRFLEITAYADVPTTNGLNLIMARAPDGWPTSGYGATATAAYLQFHGESVLGALRTLADVTGGHFRRGTGRTITWFSAFAASGVRAMQPGDPLATAGNDAIALIRRLDERHDAVEAISRIHPYGNQGTTLARTTRTPPAGYTMSASQNYIERSGAFPVRIDRVVRFPEIGRQQPDSYVDHPTMAANALFDMALAHLQRHSAEERHYAIDLVKVPGALPPGTTMDVVYYRYVDGELVLRIDTVADGAPLYVTGTTVEVSPEGVHTVSVEASSVPYRPEDDADLALEAVKGVRRTQANDDATRNITVITSIYSNDVTITGGIIQNVQIDNSPIGLTTPTVGRFTSIYAAGDITVDGLVDGVDIGAPGPGIAITSNAYTIDLDSPSGLTLGAGGLAVGAGTLIAVGASSVGIAPGAADYGYIGSTTAPWAATWRSLATLAGAGLAHTAGVLAVGQGDGLTVSADAVALTTPGTLTATTTNEAAGNHTHAVLASADLAVNRGYLAKADVDGNSKWCRIDLTDRLRAILIDSPAGTNLVLAPAQDLDLSPGGTARVRVMPDVRLQSDHFVSQLTGWGISYAGAGDFRYLYTDELHAKAFIADLEQALAGGQIICKSVAPLAEDFVAPAPGEDSPLYVEEFKGYSARVFVDGDLIRLRQFERTDTTLTIADCWGTVVYHSRDDETKVQRYTFTRSVPA